MSFFKRDPIEYIFAFGFMGIAGVITLIVIWAFYRIFLFFK